MQPQNELTLGLKNYLLDINNLTAKRLEIINIASGILSTTDDQLLLQKLAADPEIEISERILALDNPKFIKTQKDLYFFLKTQSFASEKFDFSQREDWTKIDKTIQFLRKLTQKLNLTRYSVPASKAESLDFTQLTKEVGKVLDLVAQQIGYQSESFAKLNAVIMQLPFSEEFSFYYDKLLKSNLERPIALAFFSKLSTIPEKSLSILSDILQNSNQAEQIETLKAMTAFKYFQEAPTVFQKNSKFHKDLFKLLGHKNDEINVFSFFLLSREGDSLLPDIQRELLKNKKNKSQNLSLLRFQWRISSTAKSNAQIREGLKNYKTCDLTYVNAFTEYIARKSDSQIVKPGHGNTSSVPYRRATYSVYHLPGVSTITQVAIEVPQILFENFLSCEIKYILPTTVRLIVAGNPKFKAVVQKAADNSNAEKKKYLTTIFEIPDNKYREHFDNDDGDDHS